MAELFRACDLNLKTYICCRRCLRRNLYSMLNRVFGRSSLRCEFCGVAISSEDDK